MNQDFFAFKSDRHAKFAVFIGVSFALLYKLWKYYLREAMHLDPYEDYYDYEFYSTYFRIINSIVGISAAFFLYQNFKNLLVTTRGATLLFFLSFPVAYLLLRSMFLSLEAPDIVKTIFELFFNSFVGISEEFIFRVLIMAGLWQLIGFWKASIFSSAFFALWHFDVVASVFDYPGLFMAGLFFSLGFVGRIGIVSLCFVHFLADQIHYGLIWSNANLDWVLASLVLDTLYVGIIYRLVFPSLKSLTTRF